MKLQFIKQAGGVMVPADDYTAEKLTKFKTGEQYEGDFKRHRNPKFHRKAFAFFHYCFQHWRVGKDLENLDESVQFDVFRKHLTVLAGYYDQLWNIHGEVRIEAKSLSFGSMGEDEFAQCYKALVSAACKHVFHDASDLTWNRLMEFM